MNQIYPILITLASIGLFIVGMKETGFILWAMAGLSIQLNQIIEKKKIVL